MVRLLWSCSWRRVSIRYTDDGRHCPKPISVEPAMTAFVWHELYMWHDTGSGAGPDSAHGLIEPSEHGESPASKRRLKNLLEVSGLYECLQPLKPRPATRDELQRFHVPSYVQRIATLSEQGGGDAG